MAFCSCQVALIAHGQVFDVSHQQDVPTRTLFVGVQNPKSLVLLFPGGGGMLHLKGDGSTRSQHTFVRSLDQWAQYQIGVVLVDTPYDLGDLKRGDRRGEEDHLNRVGEIVGFYKNKTGLPVWIFSHSMGTSTATNFVNQLNEDSKKLTGMILAGTIKTASLDDKANLPVEAIHHSQDQCGGTPPSASKNMIEGRPKNYISRFEVIEGGISEGDICQSFSYHGFNQTEQELIKRAAQFMLGQ